MLAEDPSLAFVTLVMLDNTLRTIALATKGFMPPDEGDALYDAAMTVGARLTGLPMVEVGSYCGRSTVWLGAAARACDTVLYAVDHHGGSEENQAGWEWHDKEVVNDAGRIDTLPFFRATMQRAALTDVVRERVGDSHEIGRQWSEKLSLCFIDGGHGREVARGDYEAWSPHVASGGVLAIHDVFEHPSDGGQAPYEEIYLPAIASGRFVEISRSGSLRVLQRTPQ
jgi:predicted O-methyltransferase YrrM